VRLSQSGLVLIGTCLVLSGPLTAQQTAGPPAKTPLEQQVANAKRAGKTELVIHMYSEPTVTEDDGTGLTGWLKAHSVLLVIADGKPPMSVASPSWIHTWHGLQIERRLNDRKPADDWACALPRPAGAAPFDATHTAVAASGGTLLIDGVRVTMTESEAYVPLLVPLQHYLLVGNFCANGTFVISDQEMPVRGDGVLLTMAGKPREPALTVDDVIQRLKR
jgi:hypothetical protein